MISISDKDYKTLTELKDKAGQAAKKVKVTVVEECYDGYDRTPNDDQDALPRYWGANRHYCSLGISEDEDRYLYKLYCAGGIRPVLGCIERRYGKCFFAVTERYEHGLCTYTATAIDTPRSQAAADKIEDENCIDGIMFLPRAELRQWHALPKRTAVKELRPLAEQVFESYAKLITMWANNEGNYLVTAYEIPEDELMNAKDDNEPLNIILAGHDNDGGVSYDYCTRAPLEEAAYDTDADYVCDCTDIGGCKLLACTDGKKLLEVA